MRAGTTERMMRRLWPVLAAAALIAASAPATAGAGTYPDPPPSAADGSSLHRIAFDMADPYLLRVDGSSFQLYGTGKSITTLTIGPNGNTGRRPALKKTPAWADPDRDVWAPTVFSYFTGKGTIGWTMYFAAPRSDTGQHCIGTAKATGPAGPFRPTKHLWCPPDASLEAIDPTMVSTPSGRYVVFKVNHANADNFNIVALPMKGAAGLAFAGTVPTVIVHSDSARMENPAFAYHDGTVWMFLSRDDFASCKYFTDAWSSASFPQGFVPRRRISSRKLTRAAIGHKGRGLCGPGGASIYQDLSNVDRIVLHAYAKNTDAHQGDRRDAWAGVLGWDAAGVPYID
jgi:hypothetical protein